MAETAAARARPCRNNAGGQLAQLLKQENLSAKVGLEHCIVSNKTWPNLVCMAPLHHTCSVPGSLPVSARRTWTGRRSSRQQLAGMARSMRMGTMGRQGDLATLLCYSKPVQTPAMLLP